MINTSPGEEWLPRGGPPLAVTFARHARDFADHRHWFHELVLITGGSAKHVVNGRSNPVRRGDVFLITTNEIHGYAAVQNLRLVNLLLDPTRIRLPHEDLRELAAFHQLFTLEPGRREASGFAPGLRLPAKSLTRAVDLAGDLDRHLAAGGPGSRCAAEGCLLLLVALICREAHSVATDPDIARLAQALAHIERHADQTLAVGELAARCGTGIRQFQRLFRATMGLSASEYHLRLRIEHAQRLLRADPDRSIAAVAAKLGFADANHFSRQFRRCLGINARTWRRDHDGDGSRRRHHPAW